MKYWKSHSIFKRLSLFYALILCVAVVLLTSPPYRSDNSQINIRAKIEGTIEADAIIAMHSFGGYQHIEQYLRSRLENKQPDLKNYQIYYELRTPQGEVALTNLPKWNEEDYPKLGENTFILDGIQRPDNKPWWTLPWLDKSGHNPDYDLLVVKRILDDGSTLYVGRDTEYWKDLLGLNRVYSLTLVVVILMGIAAGLLSSRSLLNSLKKLNRLSQEIIQTNDLSQRLSAERENSDFYDTVNNLNAMLEKVEESFESIRQASNSIAHDLRTPLTRAKNRLEGIIAENRTASPQEMSLINEEIENILQSFRSILHISQLEMGKATLEKAPIPLQVIVQDAIEMYEPIALDKEQKIQSSLQTTQIEGDKNLLFQLVSNLLDNAIKYSPESSLIKCTLTDDSPTQSTLEISDKGCGIPEEMKVRVFDRFFRAEQSRHNPGTGLGLSMAAAIAKAHGAIISLHDNHPGLLVRIVFIKHS